MDGADVISRLPLDLVISILSCLTPKEAILTSVLSRRWEKLWTYYHGNLNFRVSNKLREKGCSDYTRAMSNVLDTLAPIEGGGVIDALRIRFNLCSKNLSDVDSWVHFALEKRRVKRLDFYPIALFECCKTTYNFPPLEYFHAQQRNIQSLTFISFWRVNVSGEVIEHLLSNCPFLQTLELRQLALVHLRVSGEALALTRLSIIDFPFLTTAEISAPNLVSFQYFQHFQYRNHVQPLDNKSKNVKIGVNVPKVAQFEIGVVQIPLTTASRHLLSYFSRIQKLKVHILTKEPDDSFKVMKLTSVKHLTMVIAADICEHILAWTPLLEAFPGLNKFTLEMCYRLDARIDRVRVDDDKFLKECQFKVFEFFGFGGLKDDVDLVMYLLKNGVPLEQIIIHCDCGLPPFLDPLMPLAIKRLEEAVKLAEKLKEMIPEKVDLVVVKT